MAVTTAATNNGGAPPASGPGRAPTTPTTVVGSTQRMATRNRTRIAVGSFVMLASALGAGLAVASAGDRTPVLVVARAVPAGEVIEGPDLREVLVGSRPAESTIDASERATIIGRTASVELVAGSFLARGQLAAGPAAGTGQAVIGATLKEGHFPVELADGDEVLAVVLPPESADTTGAAAPTSIAARVVGIRSLDDGGGIAVSLAVAPDRAPALAAAGARARLTLVLAPK